LGLLCRIKRPVCLIPRPNLPQKSAKNAEKSFTRIPRIRTNRDFRSRGCETADARRDSTADYTEYTKKLIQFSLQFRVFRVFRGSISRKYPRGPIPRPNLPQKSAKNAEKSFTRIPRIRTNRDFRSRGCETADARRDSTAEYTEYTKKLIQFSLQFRVFSVFRGSIS
jgi:uncharacterized protein with NRDE domain